MVDKSGMEAFTGRVGGHRTAPIGSRAVRHYNRPTDAQRPVFGMVTSRYAAQGRMDPSRPGKGGKLYRHSAFRRRDDGIEGTKETAQEMGVCVWRCATNAGHKSRLEFSNESGKDRGVYLARIAPHLGLLAPYGRNPFDGASKARRMGNALDGVKVRPPCAVPLGGVRK